jgi:Transposase, Mutator family
MPRGGQNRVPVRVKQSYFELIRMGMPGAAAARRVGVSMSCGSLWFIDAGSVSITETRPISSRYIDQDDRIESVWPQAITQTCVIHLLRNSFRYASKRDWAAIAKDLKRVYTAASESAALDAFVAFSETWGERYPAIIKLWENAWPSSSRSWHSTRKSAA